MKNKDLMLFLAGAALLYFLTRNSKQPTDSTATDSGNDVTDEPVKPLPESVPPQPVMPFVPVPPVLNILPAGGEMVFTADPTGGQPNPNKNFALQGLGCTF